MLPRKFLRECGMCHEPDCVECFPSTLSGRSISKAQGAAIALDTMLDAAKYRKARPLYSGVLAYFPDALLAVAECSKKGNDQHNPGQPLHWAKDKSTDHADCVARHLLDHGTLDTDGIRHSAKVAWRALALLQIELDKEKK